MQDLIIYQKDSDVIVQADRAIYQDTTANFLKDLGDIIAKPFPFEMIDYNRATKMCTLDNVPFQAYPNAVCETILNKIDSLVKAQEERNAPPPTPKPTLDELKAQKLVEVDEWTKNKITGGFTADVNGKEVAYDSDKETQLTVQGILLNADKLSQYYPNGAPIRGIVVGESVKTVQYLNAEQLLEWQAQLSLHVGLCKQMGWEKQQEVANALSKEELDLIDLG